MNDFTNPGSALKERYFSLAGKYITNSHEKNAHWKEIEENYSAPGRFYHTLSHLEYMFGQLENAWALITEKENVEWAVFYHDLVYDPARHDNEERSADSAFALLMSYGVKKKTCLTINKMILSTKNHETSADNNTNYFLDADLSILGAEPDRYKIYAEDVRKEYSAYSDNIFNAGRAGVIERFLKSERIFKTDLFYRKLEKQARENLKNELEQIGKLVKT